MNLNFVNFVKNMQSEVYSVQKKKHLNLNILIDI